MIRRPGAGMKAGPDSSTFVSGQKQPPVIDPRTRMSGIEYCAANVWDLTNAEMGRFRQFMIAQ
jgi:hypothetical protein